MVINMGYFDNDILTKMMEKLDKGIPKTVEEAEHSIKSNPDQHAKIQIAANINAICQILINKGLMTEEEYAVWYNASEKTMLRKAAEEVLKVIKGDDYGE